MQGERLIRAARVGRVGKSLALVLLAAGICGPPVAAAGPAWLERHDLSVHGEDAEAPRIALDAAGDAVAVWRRFNGADYVIQTATRPAGGSWSAPVDLSAPGEEAQSPQLALDAAGDAVAVWTRFNGAESGTRSVVQSAFRPAGAAWSAPADLSAADRNAELPQVGIDGSGSAVAIWRSFDGNNFVVQAASRPAGGGWDGPVDLSATGHDGMDPRLALDSAGEATAVWSRFNGAKPAHSVIQAASRPAGGAWSGPVDVSDPAQNAQTPAVAIDAGGAVTAVWSRFDGSDYIVQAAERPPGGSWGAAADLSATGRSSVTPDVAVNASGAAVVVFSRANGVGRSIVQSAARPFAGGPWEAPIDLSSLEGVAITPEIAIDDAGEAVAVWLYANGVPAVVYCSVRPAGGAWPPPTPLSELGTDSAEPEIELDPGGNGLAAWVFEESAQNVVQAVGFDGAPPDMRSISIPAAATVRRPAGFSVAPFDVWSAIGPVGWSFDDGTRIDGASVTHAFSAVGVHTVTVTAADVLGNATSSTGSVTVFPGARAGHNALVKGRRARLGLRCPSPAGCGGRVRLNVVERIGRHGRRFRAGAAPFEMPGAESTSLSVRLSARAITLVRRAGPGGLKAQLTGPGVQHRVVVLRVAR